MKRASLLIHPEELSVAWIDRLAEESIPTLGLHPVGGKYANESLEDLVRRCEDPTFRSLLDDAANRGLQIEYEMHATRYLLPKSQFEAHPEWFRMNTDGVRTADWNCCFSNEEALDFMAEQAAILAKRLYRSTNRYFFWMDDAKEAFCHCPKCQALSPSDQQMRALNRIIRRLRKDNPKAELVYLAYFQTITPPKIERPEEGIFLEFAPFLRDFHKPIYENEECDALAGLLEYFGKEKAKVLDYWYDNSLYSKWKKPPVAFSVDRDVLEADVAYYESIGFSDLSSFACYLGADYESLYGEPNISDFGRLYRKGK